MKSVSFLGDSLEALRAFPAAARQRAGYQLDRVQRGLAPDDWKPMSTVGRGVREIRVRDEAGAFRVIYLATVGETVYVLHCFRKRTARTSRSDIAVATARFKQLMREVR
jgi:phage-related protein